MTPKGGAISFNNEEKPRFNNTTRLDDEAIEEAYARFEQWAITGASVFTQDDYDILFQAGVFEYGANAESFCKAVFERGPVPGGREPQLTGEDVSPRNATGEVDYRGSQRIVEGGHGVGSTNPTVEEEYYGEDR